MNVSKSTVVAMFTEAGVKGAAKFNKMIMGKKLKKFLSADADDHEFEEDETLELFEKLKEAGYENVTIEDDAAPVEKKEAAKKPAAKKAKKEAPKKAKAKKETKPKKTGPQVPGIRKLGGGSRVYLCGEIIAKSGLEKGITEEMKTYVDENCEKPNKKETEFALRNAWHAIHGFLTEKGEAPEFQKEEA